MKDEKSYSEEWEKDAPLLAGLPKKKPSGLPDGYFEGFADKLMDRIQDEEGAGMQQARDVPVIRAGWSNSMKYWAAAAVVVLALAGSFILVRKMGRTPGGQGVTDSQFEVTLASLETEEIVGFLGNSEVSDEDLFAALGDPENLGADMDVEAASEEMIKYLDGESLDEFDLEGLDLNDVELL